VLRMTLQEAKQYFDGHIVALKKMCDDKSPWVFLCASCVIEYLSKLAYVDKHSSGERFEKFIRKYFPKKYQEFKYKSGDMDLPKQMYHVLRCGLVHSFSFIPDNIGRQKGARDRSLVLSHDEEHLSHYSSERAPDACCLNAYKFVEDINSAMNKLFDEAEKHMPEKGKLTANIEKWLNEHPPIMANI